jgi:hypothetical protein
VVTSDVADTHPEVVARIATLMKQSHIESPLWPDANAGQPKAKKATLKAKKTAV